MVLVDFLVQKKPSIQRSEYSAFLIKYWLSRKLESSHLVFVDKP